MDTYQAIFDAVRCSIRNTDVGSAVENAIRNENISHYFEKMANNFEYVITRYDCPEVMYRPKLFIDGDKWCALYGENIQDGVCGFGNSPCAAMTDFNKQWFKSLNKDSTNRGQENEWAGT